MELRGADFWDVNLKEHLRQLEESHIGLEVRNSYEKLDEILANAFLKLGVRGIYLIKKNALKRVLC